MKEFRDRSIFIKYFDVLVEIFSVALKQNKEYKANLWSALLINLVYILVMISFYLAFFPLISSISNWNEVDYLMFIFILLLLGKFVIVFSVKRLNRDLLEGKLNIVLSKPINPFFYFSTRFNGAVLVVSSLVFLSFLFLLFYFYQFNFIFLFYFIFSAIYQIIFVTFFISTAFFIKNNFFLVDISSKINNRIKEFTPNSFRDNLFLKFIYIFPSALGSFILVNILKGNYLFFKYFEVILSSFIFFILGTYLLWYYGLKKYEAYG